MGNVYIYACHRIFLMSYYIGLKIEILALNWFL